MRFTQPVLVLALVAVLAALGIVFVAFRSANSHQDVMLGALQRGLERAYDQAIGKTPTRKTGQLFSLPTSEQRTLFLDAKAGMLRTFVNAQDVFLPRGAVAIPSDELVCVVRLSGRRFYGITGKRTWREVTRAEFASWPHESVATNAIPKQ